MATARRLAPLPTNGPPLRVLLDTNVVLSALVFGKGRSAQLRGHWQSGHCVPLVSTATVRELMRVLAYPKFKLDAPQQEELLADYLPHTETVRMPARLPVVPACRDPCDLPFLHLAAVGKAIAMVTGDADLLVIGRVLRCPIMTIDAFLHSDLLST